MRTQRLTTVIVGAGQAGLAMSRELTALGIDHLVLEQGVIGNSWRNARWDSLKLLTPNWANGLPGLPYHGEHPNGFMSAADFASDLRFYAGVVSAPVMEQTAVNSVQMQHDGYVLRTNQGPIRCRALVVATGGTALPVVPALSVGVPGHIHQTDAATYKRPSDLPEGGVLVVGASASGVQIARELHLSGRPVTIAVGSHVRLPRRYRGYDIEWWLDKIGALDERFDEVDDLARARRTPSPQLIGGPDPVDIAALREIGVEVVGRLSSIRDGRALFSGGLANLLQAADLKLGRLLDRIDLWAAERVPGLPRSPVDRPGHTPLPIAPRLQLDFASGEIASIVWACGFKPAQEWLHALPIFDRRGRLVHHGGVVAAAPGLYVLGLPFLRRRRSLQISGVGPDTSDIAEHLHGHLRSRNAAEQPQTRTNLAPPCLAHSFGEIR